MNAKFVKHKPIKSSTLTPKNSPRMVTLVPGGPSFGDKPVTTGFGPISITSFQWKNSAKFTENIQQSTQTKQKSTRVKIKWAVMSCQMICSS